MGRNVVVYTTAFHPRWRSDAARGGPMGEILMADALVDGVTRLGADVQVLATLREFARHAATRVFSGAFTYFLDPATLALACRYHLLSARHAARVFVLDWYGTPPSRVSGALPGLRGTQYLLPYPPSQEWNTFLGYPLTDAEGAPIADSEALSRYVGAALEEKSALQGVVWGKEGRYLAGVAGDAVRAVAATCPLHFTVAPERGLDAAALPPGAVNHGAVDRAQWRALLRRSSFVLGLGDPVSGPTALEALLEGCAYLDPRYPSPRVVNEISELTISSQHPYAASIGEPFVYGVDLRDPPSVARAAAASTDPSPRLRSLPALVSALAPFTQRAYLDRLSSLLSI